MSFILIALAAVFNAVMDALENENFSRSVFKLLNPKFWYKRESWKYAKKIFGYKVDAWHLAKSSMIICVAFAVCFGGFDLMNVLLLGATWIGVFNISYKIIVK